MVDHEPSEPYGNSVVNQRVVRVCLNDHWIVGNEVGVQPLPMTMPGATWGRIAIVSLDAPYKAEALAALSLG